MEQIDIKVRKNAKGDLLDGPFFIKELDFDECFKLQDKASKDDSNSRLIQMCLVDSEGAEVFKPQQISTIKKKISGVDFMACLIAANGLNDFEKIAMLAEKYSKN